MAEPGRVAPELRLCRGCRQYVWEGPAACHFCGADVEALEAEHQAAQAAVWEAAEALRAAIAEAEASRS
jgi:hypothetical protein